MSVWRTIERRFRHGAARALLLFPGLRSRSEERVRLAEIRRVLFVRPNFRMGNLLLTTPALSSSRRALPRAEIHLLTTSAYGDLLHGHPDVDRLRTYHRRMLLAPWSLIGLIRRLRRSRYDLVVDCSEGDSLTGALLARFSGGRWRMAPAAGRYRALFNVRVDIGPRPVHRVERLLRLLEGIGIESDRPDMSIAIDPSEREWAGIRWRETGLDDGSAVVGVNIGARGEKRWPMASFARLVRRLQRERGARIVVFAGPEDLDRLARVEGRLPEGVVVDTTDRPRRFAALLERCAVVITGDTGPMHLSAAVGTPTISIFLKPNHPVFAPLGELHRCLHATGGSVSPDEVFEAAADVLDRIG